MSDDLLNILDSEIDAMDKGPIKWATEHQGKAMDLEAFRRAIIEQFAEIGFKVEVKAYETNERGTIAFDFEILGRTERKAFDFDKMVHEVTNDFLGERGADQGFIPAPQPTEAQRKQAAHGNHTGPC